MEDSRNKITFKLWVILNRVMKSCPAPLPSALDMNRSPVHSIHAVGTIHPSVTAEPCGTKLTPCAQGALDRIMVQEHRSNDAANSDVPKRSHKVLP